MQLASRHRTHPIQHGKKARPKTTWPFGRNSPQIAAQRNYFPPFGAGGTTTSLCCAQAPSPNPVTKTAITTIIFKNFNLSRLLSQQVAPVCLGREPGGSNAFLKFFKPWWATVLFRIAGCPCACGDSLFPLSTSTKAQSSSQNGHDHNRLYQFQSISPPFVASCTARVRSHTDNNVFVKFFGCIAWGDPWRRRALAPFLEIPNATRASRLQRCHVERSETPLIHVRS